MFYAKAKSPVPGETAIAEIRDDNVFTRCYECGAEVFVDLAELIVAKDFDLYGTGVLCDDCANMKRKNRKLTVTLDGVTLLNNVLNKAGYGERLAKVYDEFNIYALDDLEPNQYESFAEALTRMAAGDYDFKKGELGDPLSFVPKAARGCMTNDELEDALGDMQLSPAIEKAVREVCRRGFCSSHRGKEVNAE